MNVLMFSGQGSQYYRMGRSFFEREPIFRNHMERLDRVVVTTTGASVIDTLYHSGKTASEPLTDIRITNPAIFMVEYALARTLLDLGLQIALTLGASLGAFAAMTISGILDEYDALATVLRMANATAGRVPQGAMIAVVGPLSIQDDTVLGQNSEVAAVNFDTHHVISVASDRLAIVEARLTELKVIFQRLPVSFAFHSQAMDTLEGSASAMLADVPLHQARTPFACCAHVDTFTQIPPSYVWPLIRRPIRFRDTIRELERQHAFNYIDISPSATLSTFLRYLLPEARDRISKTMDPFGNDEQNLASILARYTAPAACGIQV